MHEISSGEGTCHYLLGGDMKAFDMDMGKFRGTDI